MTTSILVPNVAVKVLKRADQKLQAALLMRLAQAYGLVDDAPELDGRDGILVDAILEELADARKSLDERKEAERERKRAYRKAKMSHDVPSCPGDIADASDHVPDCPSVSRTSTLLSSTLLSSYSPHTLLGGGTTSRAPARVEPTTTIFSEDDYLAKARSEGAAPDEQERFAAYNVARGGTMAPDDAWTRFVAKRRPDEAAAATRRKAETAKKAAKETAEDAARRFARPIVERWIREHPDGDEDAFAEDVVYRMDLKSGDPKIYALYNVFRECVA